jgi:hypothetical protein
MGWLRQWRLALAARPYAQQLRNRLVQGWGASRTYTRGQIDAAAHDLRLNPKYILIAYAAFLSGEELAAARHLYTEFTEKDARIAFSRWRPASMDGQEDASGGLYSTGDS